MPCGPDTVNTAFTISVLLFAWEHYGRQLGCMHIDGITPVDGDLPYYLDELKWGLDWVTKMQSDDGRVYHKLTRENFEGLATLPGDDDEPRFFSDWSTAATASFVAACAQAARNLAPFNSTHDGYTAALLDAAWKSYNLLLEHPDAHRADQEPFTTGMYDGLSDGAMHHETDARIWAYAELYAATGDVSVLSNLEELMGWYDTPTGACAGDWNRSSLCLVPDEVDWNQVRSLGIFRYLTLPEELRAPRDPALVAKAESQLELVVGRFVHLADNHPFGRTLGEYTKWGVNGEVARNSMFFTIARMVLGDRPEYSLAQQLVVDQLLGRNEHTRSYITKVGQRPPEHPHHRASLAYLDAWPGMLVGGPNPVYRDFWLDFYSNEIAINWQAGAVYALAPFYGACDREPELLPLKQVANGTGVLVGALYSGDRVLRRDEDAAVVARYEEQLVHHFDLITAENGCKPSRIFPTPDRLDDPDYSACDYVINFAEAHGLKVRFHLGAWGDYNPEWMNNLSGGAEKKAVLERMTRTVLGHYKDRECIVYWDVVNEPICDDIPFSKQNCDSKLGNLKGDGTWYPDVQGYLPFMFQLAREILGPGKKLLLNDYNIESMDDPVDRGKADRLYQVLQEAKDDGIPIDAVGFQFHIANINLGNSFLGWIVARNWLNGVAQQFARVAALGYEIHITELGARPCGALVHPPERPPPPSLTGAGCAPLPRQTLAATIRHSPAPPSLTPPTEPTGSAATRAAATRRSSMRPFSRSALTNPRARSTRCGGILTATRGATARSWPRTTTMWTPT